ncbi:hypothetical protein [Rhizobium leguminosarum]|uniref:hypothetical protein n=1 Tax=Rhizobium leguminosarum TaxID=384 RepID=UPI001C938710|nr:hypothetical protein [Rhizobium leguminosarum]
MIDITEATPGYPRVVILTIALFLSYLTVAMALPAIPVHVVECLDLDNTWGGLAVGIAFLSTILTRGHAGAWTDRVGGKLAMARMLRPRWSTMSGNACRNAIPKACRPMC